MSVAAFKRHWPTTAQTLSAHAFDTVVKVARDTDTQPKHVHHILNHPLAAYLMGCFYRQRHGGIYDPAPGVINSTPGDGDNDADEQPGGAPDTDSAAPAAAPATASLIDLLKSAQSK